MKIYTKTGDKGKTSLLSGGRVSKSDLRISAYGSTDELNSFTGLLAAHDIRDNHKNDLLEIQNKLYHIGAMLAVRGEHSLNIPNIGKNDILKIENKIDSLNKNVPPLKHFIIPGGNQMTAVCHICRSVCRRAERDVVKLANEEEIDILIITYLNRLSDYFFVLARVISFESGTDEIACKF